MPDGLELSPTAYLMLLEQFVKTGEVFDYETVYINDPILRYFYHLMNDPLIQSRVLGSRLAGKVFYEVVGRFVLECIHERTFVSQMSIGEQTEMGKMLNWSMHYKENHWQSLLQQLDEKHKDDGFDIDFLKKRFKNGGWKKPENWERLKREWQGAIDERKRRQVTKKIESKGGAISGGFQQALSRLEDHIRNEGDTEDQLLQAWERMDGRSGQTYG